MAGRGNNNKPYEKNAGRITGAPIPSLIGVLTRISKGCSGLFRDWSAPACKCDKNGKGGVKA